MSRGVLFISTMDDGTKRFPTCVIEEAFGTQTTGETFPIKCTSGDAEFLNLTSGPATSSNRVQEAGRKLYDALVAHKDVAKFFAQTDVLPPLGGQPPSVCPLYLRMGTPDAEDLPWEILWETQKTFMILDPKGRWPIARLAAMPRQPEPLHKNVGSGLRLSVVLAAADESGAEEWASISAKFGSLKASLDVFGLVSEDAAKDAMTKDAGDWAAVNPARKVEVDFIGDGSSLINRLRAQAPNIVHIFCHGVSDPRPELELETRADRLTEKKQGSIRLRSEDLLALASLDSLWLVVLNCCQGAKTAPQLHSLARDLVAAGVPAVAAMRESIQVDDAHLFAEHFYSALFAQLNSIFSVRSMNPPPDPIPFQEIVWLQAVHEARRKLSSFRERLPEGSVEWTYPVLYVNRDRLHLHPRDLTAVAILTAPARLELLSKLDLLRAIREPLVLATDADAVNRRASIDAEIHQIEAQLAGG
jgi:hypothetical protein